MTFLLSSISLLVFLNRIAVKQYIKRLLVDTWGYKAAFPHELNSSGVSGVIYGLFRKKQSKR